MSVRNNLNFEGIVNEGCGSLKSISRLDTSISGIPQDFVKGWSALSVCTVLKPWSLSLK